MWSLNNLGCTPVRCYGAGQCNVTFWTKSLSLWWVMWFGKTLVSFSLFHFLASIIVMEGASQRSYQNTVLYLLDYDAVVTWDVQSQLLKNTSDLQQGQSVTRGRHFPPQKWSERRKHLRSCRLTGEKQAWTWHFLGWKNRIMHSPLNFCQIFSLEYSRCFQGVGEATFEQQAFSGQDQQDVSDDFSQVHPTGQLFKPAQTSTPSHDQRTRTCTRTAYLCFPGLSELWSTLTSWGVMMSSREPSSPRPPHSVFMHIFDIPVSNFKFSSSSTFKDTKQLRRKQKVTSHSRRHNTELNTPVTLSSSASSSAACSISSLFFSMFFSSSM